MTPATSISNLLGETISHISPLAGGDVADVLLITTNDGNKFILKRPKAGQYDTSAIEAAMLTVLREKSSLPVPHVVAQQDHLLILNYIEHTGGNMRGDSAIDGARHIAALHSVTSNHHGYKTDTVIGPLVQKNTRSDNWLDFYIDHRLMDMAKRAVASGKLPLGVMLRLESLTQRLGDYIPATPKASLLHGDLWGGNILVDGPQVAGFIDPAIYYGHAEMDLAFLTLFGSAGDDFFAVYNEINPIEGGFFEERRDLYTLWPLLVHIRLFGGSYVTQLDAIITKFGH